MNPADKSTRLHRDRAVLVIVDVQEKLVPVIFEATALLANLERLVRGCHLLGLPALVTEQYVRGLGPTVERLRNTLQECGSYEPIEKNCFSAAGCEPFSARLAALQRDQVLVAGVETHVCVYQTCIDLLAEGLQVTLVADAVSSRTERNRELALRRLEREGVRISSTEMALFELTVRAGSDEFRAISRLVR
jgi:nicotinamidase-related amidase